MKGLNFTPTETGVLVAPLLFCQVCYGLVDSVDGVECGVCGFRKTKKAFEVRRIVLGASLLLATMGANASDCPDMYLAKQEPVLIAPLAGQLYELCSAEFAVMVSEVNKTALYAAEKLTPGQMKGANRIGRDHTEFYEDYRLPEAIRVSSYAYKHSGFDRGHLAPAGDFSSHSSQKESFSLANIVPQSAVVNRGVWSDIEKTVRHLAKKGSVHVVTGPLYLGPTTYLKNGGIPIPSHLFKAVFAPASNVVGVYIVGNATDERIAKMSIAEFTDLAGIDVFPNLPADVKKIKGAIPSPLIQEKG